jgi:hypothetical protein
VLQVISNSPGDLQPVFEAMLEKAVRICDAMSGGIYRWDGNAFSLVATHNLPPAYAESRRFSPFRPGAKHPLRRMIATKAVVHIADLAAESAWAAKFWTSAICLSVNGRTSWRFRANEPISSFSFSIGTFMAVRTPPSSTAATNAG